MKKLPNALFVASVDKDYIAVDEATRLGIPVFAIVDTDINPDKIDHIIPANDDAVRSISLILQTLSNAVIAGTKGELIKEENKDSEAKSAEEKVDTVKGSTEEKTTENKGEVENGESKEA